MTFLKGGLSSVGDVVSSMLSEAQFQAERDDTWVLMDGACVACSDFACITCSCTIPDARGQFLRGKNNSRSDGQENPDGDSTLGVQQTDSMQGHVHRTFGSNSGVGSQTYSQTTGTDRTLTSDVPFTDGVNGTPRTDSETRVRNITINYFIKINR